MRVFDGQRETWKKPALVLVFASLNRDLSILRVADGDRDRGRAPADLQPFGFELRKDVEALVTSPFTFDYIKRSDRKQGRYWTGVRGCMCCSLLHRPGADQGSDGGAGEATAGLLGRAGGQ